MTEQTLPIKKGYAIFMVIFASDLDNTLIYSYKKEIGKKRLVETKEGKALSYMTEPAYDMLNHLPHNIQFIPVTTRSVEQYKRIRLFEKGEPEYALAANGGILLHNGRMDSTWYERSKRMAKPSQCEIERAMDILEKDKNVCMEVRLVDGLFVFTKSTDADSTIKRLKESLNTELVSVFSNGVKIYAFPKQINKGEAVKRIRKQLGISFVVSSGDSLFDIPMLNEADFAVAPKSMEMYLKKEQNQYRIVEDNILLSDALLNQVISSDWSNQ